MAIEGSYSARGRISGADQIGPANGDMALFSAAEPVEIHLAIHEEQLATAVALGDCREDAVVTTPTVLVATWRDGLFVVAGENSTTSSAISRSERSQPTGSGGALAIVDGHSLLRRAPDGVWSTIATTELDLACCVAVGDVIYVGTDDARVLRVGADGALEQLRGFDAVAGRDTWYAGSAVINGQRVGPPLGIRSMTATSDGAVLLVNVHVGGIPRSTDGGATWQPTIDVESDVHEVRAHPNRPGIVMAAAAIGLCTSRDGGMTWDVEQEGLHASYCSAVAFVGDDVLVSASVDHFAAQGAIYRRRVDGHDRWSPSAAACPHGPTASSTQAASPRAARRLRSPIGRATSTCRPTPAVAGRAEPAVSHLRAASSSSERDTRTAKRRAGRVMCHLAFSTFRESTLQRRRTL